MMKKLYIIHGWTYEIEPWRKTVKDLKKYGVEAKLLAVPGLGEKSDKVFTITDYVEWAAKNIPKGSVALGHSNGGRILLNMLNAKGSDYLSGLILLDSAGIYEKSTKRDLMRKLSKVFAPLKKSAFMRKVVYKLAGAHDYNDAPENMKKTLSNMLESDKVLDISQITTPTRIVWGSDDNITPLRQGEKMCSLLKNAKLTVKEGWRHSHYLKSTDELAQEIASQLEKFDGEK
ncbi:alpha/beta hydrolase [Candidatus Saccharibacteria bacterium]|nr:alpha/beta hydrolase [Candidatus Saccharibacteria bacterium]